MARDRGGRLHIALAAPTRPDKTAGNQVTADRWAHQLGLLGHEVTLVPVYETGTTSPVPPCDVVIALHAGRCAAFVASAASAQPKPKIVVALAGTDLYQDLPDSAAVLRSLSLADRLVVLQAHGVEHLASIDADLRAKTSIVHQSVEARTRTMQPPPNSFRVVVLAHLRDVKDPLLAARSARLLPPESRIEVVHAGAAYTSHWRRAAKDEELNNGRYRWLGAIDRPAAAELLASAHVLACTSLLEGGANVVSEAIAAGLPVVGTDIGGNRGLLGDDHRGLVPVGDDRACARLLRQLETDPQFYATLASQSQARQWLVEPANERREWAETLRQVAT